MSPVSPQFPRLTVVSRGPLRGQTFQVRLGSQLVGRAADADVVINSPDLSRKHAYLTWDGRRLQIADAGSTNGTTVDGELVEGPRPLRSGELLGLGDLLLRVEAPVSDDTVELSPSRPPVQFRSEVDANYGQINQAARDVNIRSLSENHFGQDNPLEELFRGRGAGRALIIVGLIIALSGFAVWMSLIFSGSGADTSTNPFEKHVLGLPIAPVAFGAFGVGGLIAALGTAMSKTARTRKREQAMQFGRW